MRRIAIPEWLDWLLTLLVAAGVLLLGFWLLSSIGCDRFPAPRVSATLEWDPPAANEDGSPLTDLAGYKVYYGAAPDQLDQVADVGLVTRYELRDLSHGDWWFEVTAYNAAREESRPSNRAAKLRLPLPGKMPAGPE